jgi:hypothetical protein
MFHFLYVWVWEIRIEYKAGHMHGNGFLEPMAVDFETLGGRNSPNISLEYP